LAKHLPQLHLYPDSSSHALVQRLSRFLGVYPEEIVLGSGSNELIELLIRTFMVPERDEALLCQGSFVMYKVALQAHGRSFVEVPMQTGFRYDLSAMAQRITSRTRFIFLSNPDNPTGTAFSRGELLAFLARVPDDCLVVLDEAYFEFVTWPDYPNGLVDVRGRKNAIVLRTFSKAYGLAGLRVGYGVMHPELVAYLNRTRMPFNVSSAAQWAAAAALDDTEHVARGRALTRAGIEELTRALRSLGAQVPESHANFVFADFGRPAQPLYEALLKGGVITRPIANYGFPHALRISVGLERDNQRLVSALREIL
jgi:histidinol-phosphate aminotransferase